MENRGESVPVSFSNSDDETRRLQNKLAVRLLLIFFIPLIVVVVLGVYSFRLSSRVKEVEAVALMANIEKLWQTGQNYELAIQEYKKIAEKYPRPDIFVRLAGLYYRLGDPKLAFETLDRAKQLDKNYWETYSTLAYIYLSEKREKDAIEAGETALRLNPYDAQTYNNLAWLYATTDKEEVRNFEKAKEYALKAVNLTHGQQPDYLDTLAESHYRIGEIEQALKRVKQALNKELWKVKYLESQLNKFQAKSTKALKE